MNQDPDAVGTSPPAWPPPPTNAPFTAEASPTAAVEAFRPQSVWLVLLLTVITLGVYAAFWVKRQAVVIGALRPDLKLPLPFVNVVLAVAFLSAGLDVVGIFSRASLLSTVSDVLDRVWEIMLLVVTFQVRSAINTMLRSSRRDAYWFSGVFTFLFGVIYLQYKINKNIRNWENDPLRAVGV